MGADLHFTFSEFARFDYFSGRQDAEFIRHALVEFAMEGLKKRIRAHIYVRLLKELSHQQLNFDMSSAFQLQRAIGPMLQRLARAQTGNMFWLSQLSGATSEPMRVDNLLSWGADLKSMTPATLQKLAKRYLKANKTFAMVVAPESAAPTK